MSDEPTREERLQERCAQAVATWRAQVDAEIQAALDRGVEW